MKIRLDNIEVQFPTLIEPEQGYTGYKILAVITTEQRDLLLSTVAAVKEEKKLKKSAAVPKITSLADLYEEWEPSEERPEAENPFERNKDKFQVTVRTNFKPKVIDTKKEVIDNDEVQAGDIANIVVDIASYERTGVKAMRFTLMGIQKVRDGEFRKSRSDSTSDFDVIEEEEALKSLEEEFLA